MGSAASAPASFLPSVFFSSKPTQTPHVTDGEKPMNHASVKSLVVPVLPASGCLSAEAVKAVPIRYRRATRIGVRGVIYEKKTDE